MGEESESEIKLCLFDTSVLRGCVNEVVTLLPAGGVHSARFSRKAALPPTVPGLSRSTHFSVGTAASSLFPWRTRVLSPLPSAGTVAWTGAGFVVGAKAGLG